jgi:hypothetical protein
MARSDSDFQTIRSEGGLLPSDLLRRILDPAGKLDGTRPEDYGLPAGERLNEAITQSWNRLRKQWADFQTALAGLGEGEAGTGLTNDKWSLPLLRELGFGLLPTTSGPEINGRTYAISRFFGPVPIHLVGVGVSLDRKAAGQRGAATVNPHGLVQEFLNRSSGHLWAFISNGLRLRILRDNQAISRQSFLEFDVEAMFAGEVYSDFVLLWLTAHATRFAPRESGRADSCWLEEWTKEAQKLGTRALGDLRGGVERALQILGEGFTSHPRNATLRDALRGGEIPLADFHGQLLRVVYRLIFLFVAEDRTLEGQALLHPRDESDLARMARRRYADHYGTARLRHLAGTIKGSRHSDLWRQFQTLAGALSGEDGFAAARANLALPVLGSFLWSPASTATLNDAELTNYDLLEALRNLAFTSQGRVLRPVDYRNLGAEELGGVYESLLGLTPQISADGARFTFAEFAGNERKTSGSYYTPDSLVQCLLDSALDPVVEAAVRGKSAAEAERAILALKVCDPAVGSGHFLLGAAHRLARHLARVRAQAQGESEPSPPMHQHALRDVIGRCLYGVDINPMAAELCRVSLWLEAVDPGRPLTFLDHHIRIGNSLFGATPALIAAGIPDDAFSPVEGDDRKACTVLKRRNRAERSGLGPLFAQQDAESLLRLQQASAAIEELPDDTPEGLSRKESAFRRNQGAEEYLQKRQLADAWCAAFAIRKHFTEPSRESSASGLTQEHLTALAEGRALPADLAAELARVATQYQFFHWHLAFPEVIARGGFDCVLGNPPWERIKLQDTEFFAQLYPALSEATDAAAKRLLLSRVPIEQPELWHLYTAALRSAEIESNFLRKSGKYPLCGVGDVNTYAVFAELAKDLVAPLGVAGLIVPSGIATDNNTKHFFDALTRSHRLKSLYDFENRERVLFPSVYYRMRFCLLTLTGVNSGVPKADYVFLAYQVDDLRVEARHFTLSADDIALLNPDTKTCPMFLSAHDADITLSLFSSHPVLSTSYGPAPDKWDLKYKRIFDMSTDAELFHARPDTADDADRFVRLYEGRMFSAYNHRAASMGVTAENVHRTGVKLETPLSCLLDPRYVVSPRFWVVTDMLLSRLPEAARFKWCLALKDITSATNARTVIAAMIPFAAAGNTSPVLVIRNPIELAGCFLANLNSFVLDFMSRKKVSGNHLTLFILEQLPFLEPQDYFRVAPWDPAVRTCDWVLQRVLELTYTAWDLQPFARDCGRDVPPFKWDEERRFLLRCELDAAFFHLYLPQEANGGWRLSEDETADNLARLRISFSTPRDAVAFVMDSFPIVRLRDEEQYSGDYRTKRVILEIYEAMAEAIRTDQTYCSRLDPPPADPWCCHPAREASRA